MIGYCKHPGYGPMIVGVLTSGPGKSSVEAKGDRMRTSYSHDRGREQVDVNPLGASCEVLL